ncbi:MAG: SAM-dependent chlorinase/fluorinase [Gemmatimonadales bacterium]|jgi:S-adenosylmethionine hydrolase|nr:SAM-dependent chlorinase/fluorinase [Gemmatimonadales bacterium]
MMPIITLLTDFGLQDSYVAEMKGAILDAVPDVTLVDVTHSVPPGDILTGQYLLARTWRRFPAGTAHLVVIDPGVGTERRAIAVAHAGHAFVGPDNGVLTPVLEGAAVVQLPIPADASPTFHGRDVFAPAAARLAAGERVSALGTPVPDPVQRAVPVAVRRGDEVVGCVIYVDGFGTLVTNLSAELTGGVREVTVFGEAPIAVGRTFADVPSGGLVAFVGSGGTVEIAARDRSAALVLGVGVGAEVRCRTA